MTPATPSSDAPTLRSRLAVAVSLGFLAFLFLASLSSHIDFHPDEAIYFDGIPINISNDAGILYHAFYGLALKLQAGPQGARLASAWLGGASLTLLLLFFTKFCRSPLQPALIAATWLLSYQTIFVFDRVRPEALWWTLTAAMPLLMHRRTWNTAALTAVAALLFLLPLNHRLSWFPAVFALGYLFLFVRPQVGWRTFMLFPGAFVAGIAFNIAIRAWLIDRPIADGFAVAGHSVSVSARLGLNDFIRLVFRDAAIALDDSAANHNLFRMARRHDNHWASHAYIQNALWALMIVLPLVGRSWRERYTLATPLAAFVGFFASGYYNPTYAPGVSMLCVILSLWLVLTRQGLLRCVALFFVGLSILVGVSFLGTRVLNHGQATYFAQEAELASMLRTMPDLRSVALPERYQIAASGLDVQRHVTYKSVDIADVDVLVLDNYDLLMYGFVPDFDKRKAELRALANSMCLLAKHQQPVYQYDSAFPLQDDGWGGKFSTPGSWFFRNSVTSSIYVYKRCTASGS